MSSGKELQCERRRMTYLKAFDEYENHLTTVKTGRKKGKKKKKFAKEKQGIANKPSNDPINLPKCEIEALKSLKNKIKEGSLIISQTDKSSRFSVMSKR